MELILDKISGGDGGLSPLFLPWDIYCLSSQRSGGGGTVTLLWAKCEGLAKSFKRREITTRVALYITMDSRA